jgi:hypothetical protein
MNQSTDGLNFKDLGVAATNPEISDLCDRTAQALIKHKAIAEGRKLSELGAKSTEHNDKLVISNHDQIAPSHAQPGRKNDFKESMQESLDQIAELTAKLKQSWQDDSKTSIDEINETLKEIKSDIKLIKEMLNILIEQT